LVAVEAPLRIHVGCMTKHRQDLRTQSWAQFAHSHCCLLCCVAQVHPLLPLCHELGGALGELHGHIRLGRAYE